MATPIPFRIDAGVVGARVEVAGEDVTDRVAGWRVEGTPNAPTVLTLHHLTGGAPIEGDAIVQVIAEGGDFAGQLAQFLAQINPAQLEQEALNGHDLSQGVTAAILIRLLDIARGV